MEGAGKQQVRGSHVGQQFLSCRVCPSNSETVWGPRKLFLYLPPLSIFLAMILHYVALSEIIRNYFEPLDSLGEANVRNVYIYRDFNQVMNACRHQARASVVIELRLWGPARSASARHPP